MSIIISRHTSSKSQQNDNNTVPHFNTTVGSPLQQFGKRLVLACEAKRSAI